MIFALKIWFCFPVLERVSLPKKRLSDYQLKQQILEKEILYLRFPTLN